MSLGILIYVVFIAVVLLKTSGKNKKTGGKSAEHTAHHGGAKPLAEKKVPRSGSPKQQAQTVTSAKHEHDLYAGSMDAQTGEGEDPCHEDELHPVRKPVRDEPEPAVVEENSPEPVMDWTNRDEVVRAFIMQTVLERPCDRKRRR